MVFFLKLHQIDQDLARVQRRAAQVVGQQEAHQLLALAWVWGSP
jgi:hypothetical protein